jgi:hypothetical protein
VKFKTEDKTLIKHLTAIYTMISKITDPLTARIPYDYCRPNTFEVLTVLNEMIEVDIELVDSYLEPKSFEKNIERDGPNTVIDYKTDNKKIKRLLLDVIKRCAKSRKILPKDVANNTLTNKEQLAIGLKMSDIHTGRLYKLAKFLAYYIERE